jgi:heat shock protein HslJ
MKTKFALPLLALSLAACMAYPPGPGYPPGGPPPNYPGSGAMMLTGTNWRVTAINGRQTPPRNFYLNFIPDRIGAKFGCNSLGAGYSVTGSVLTAGAVMATRMACPDMSFENEGSAILALPMNIAGGGDRLVLSNSAGSIELARAE